MNKPLWLNVCNSARSFIKQSCVVNDWVRSINQYAAFYQRQFLLLKYGDCGIWRHNADIGKVTVQNGENSRQISRLCVSYWCRFNVWTRHSAICGRWSRVERFAVHVPPTRQELQTFQEVTKIGQMFRPVINHSTLLLTAFMRITSSLTYILIAGRSHKAVCQRLPCCT